MQMYSIFLSSGNFLRSLIMPTTELLYLTNMEPDLSVRLILFSGSLDESGGYCTLGRGSFGA